MNVRQRWCLYCWMLLLILKNGSLRKSGMKSYSGYQVYNVYNSDAETAAQLESLYNQLNVDVWQVPSLISNKSTVMVAGENTSQFRAALENLDLSYRVQIEDVQYLINRSMRRTKKRRHPRKERAFRFDQYHTHTEIHRWMKFFASRNAMVTLLRVGTTYEGRTIFGLKMSATTGGKRKPVIWQDSLIHSREWISGATILWVANQLVADYKANDTVVVDLFKKFDFIFVPLWNVDGYLYTWKHDRLWRKSRRRNSFNLCPGVDLNRNFDTPNLNGVHFCSSIYRGTGPFSEPETESVARFLRMQNLAAYITIHAYYQLWMFPYGYKENSCPDHDELNEFSQLAVNALNSVHNSSYRQGSIHDSAYMVAGGSIDWVYDSLCVKHSYGVELRDEGEYGFILPPEQIVPTSEEYYAGLKRLATQLLETTSYTSNTCRCQNKINAKLNKSQRNCTSDSWLNF